MVRVLSKSTSTPPYLTIMHGLKEQPLPNREDIYTIDDLPREVVKKWFAISFGVQKFHRQWLKGNVKDLKENCPENTGLG